MLISAVLFGGVPRAILQQQAIRGRVELFLSNAIFEELQEVLGRPKFGFSSEQTSAIASQLLLTAKSVKPTRKVCAVEADPDDNIFLECAYEGRPPRLSGGIRTSGS